MLFSAIFVAVAGVVFSNALIRGYQGDMAEDAVANLTGNVKVLATGYLADPSIERSFELAPGWKPSIDADALLGWTARVRVPAVVLTERETRGVILVGIDPAVERQMSFFGEVALDGEPLEDADDGRILLGKDLARQLETQTGRRVVVMSQGSDGRTREAGFRIAAVFDAEGTALERAFAFTGLTALQALLDTQGVTEVSIRLKGEELEHDATATVRADLAGRDELEVRGWRELEPQAAAMVEYADSAILIWLGIMLVGLAFGLVNTLITAVMERIRELGMLRALGMRRSAVVAQVVMESCLIVLVGVALGVVAGVGLVAWVHDGIDLSRWATGVELAGLRSLLVPKLLPGDVVLVIAVSLLFGLLASVYPAWRAVRTSPLEALRR